jgi:ribonuclease G
VDAGGDLLGKQIIADSRLEQTRVAVLEDDILAELYIESKESKNVVGNIYRGKVKNVLPGMQAAFIDVGLEKNAFLYIGDMTLPANKSVFEFSEKNQLVKEMNQEKPKPIREGQEITVQILKEAIGTKGARVSTHITLPGRYLVVLPGVEHIGVSRRIENEDERIRLRKMLEGIRPQGMGLIVRTAARDRELDELEADMMILVRLWKMIETKQKSGAVPRVLHEDMDIISRTVRDVLTADTECFTLNNQADYQKVVELTKVFSPTAVDKIKLFHADENIFQYYGINDKIDKAIQKKVWLKNGGYLVIDTTEALTVIDVNTGRFVGKIDLENTVVQTNLEAADEIANQIRLRDIGGIIIIDFIDMIETEHKEQLVERLRQATKRDRTRTNVLGLTGLGLVEMTRKKVRKRLSATLLKPCPYCNGTGKVFSELMILAHVEKDLEQMFKTTGARAAIVEVHPSVAAVWRDEDGKAFDMLEKVLDKNIYILEKSDLHVEESNIIPIHSESELEGLMIQTPKDNTLH